MRVRRYILVASPTQFLHRIYKTRYNPVEGDKTACGTAVTTKWRRAAPADKATHSRCLRCEKANVSV